LNTETEKINSVIASLRTKDADPNDVGLGVAEPSSVGTVGGFSWEVVRLAKRMVDARLAPGDDKNAVAAAKATMICFIVLPPEKSVQPTREFRHRVVGANK
jgi:hypothetical protein